MKIAPNPLKISVQCVMRSTSLLIVLLGLSGCSTSQDTKGVSPAENIPSYSAGIAEINAELASKWSLTALEGVPVLVGPQR